MLTDRPTDRLDGCSGANTRSAGQKSSSARPNFTPTPKSVSVTIYELKVVASTAEVSEDHSYDILISSELDLKKKYVQS